MDQRGLCYKPCYKNGGDTATTLPTAVTAQYLTAALRAAGKHPEKKSTQPRCKKEHIDDSHYPKPDYQHDLR